MNTRFLMTLCCCLLPFTLKGAGKEDMKWFTDAKFGMFIHWGLYAMPARHEWVKSRENCR